MYDEDVHLATRIFRWQLALIHLKTLRFMSEHRKSSPLQSQREIKCDPQDWLEEHGDALFAYALIRVQDASTAEDLVQETLLAAIQSQDGFQRQSSLRTWLIGILRHKIIDFFRRQSRAPLASPGESPEVEPATEPFNRKGHWASTVASWPRDPQQALEFKEFWQVFDDCRGKLPPPLSAAFTLRELDRLSTEEICKELEISATNLSVRIHRARLFLRECLDRNWFHPSD